MYFVLQYVWRPFWIQDGDFFIILQYFTKLLLVIHLHTKFRISSSNGAVLHFGFQMASLKTFLIFS